MRKRRGGLSPLIVDARHRAQKSTPLHPCMQILINRLTRISDQLNANRIVRHRPSLNSRYWS